MRSLTSSPWLFSALATADITHLRTSLAMRLRENSRSASAVSTLLPRISCASRLSFCGETRKFRATALASLSESTRSRFALPIVFRLRLTLASGRRFCPHSLLVAAVTVEGPRRRKLAELVADHVFGDADGNVLLPVVDPEGQTDELRQDRRAPAPDADDLVATRCAHGLRLLEQITVDKRTFPNRACHVALLLTYPYGAAER